jgi:ribosomal protein L40E
MDDAAKKRTLTNMWVCMSCNATMRSQKKPACCRKCGSIRLRAKKKGKRTK